MNERDGGIAEPEPSLAELIDSVARKLVTGLVIAGALIGLGIWGRSAPKPVHYQIVAAEGRLYRLNTETGWVIGCDGSRCATVVRPGQELEGRIEAAIAARQLGAPAAPPAAPAAAPAAPPAPASAPVPAPAPAPAPARR